MIDDDPDLEPKYRAPRAFGPMPGPRNIPLSERTAPGRPDEVTTSLAVTLEAEADELTRLLPPHTRLAGPAALTVTATRFENLLWLAGRGYPILTVTFPVEYVGPSTDQPIAASYLAVLWEGLADPVTTGREELAFPKLYADLRAPRLADVSPTGAAVADASWDGFRFLDLTADGLQDAPTEPNGPVLGTLVHRYVPAVGDLGRSAVDHLVLHPRSGKNPNGPTLTHRRVGTGHFAFHHATFAEMPVQYPVVSALAGLTLGASGPAVFTRTTSTAGVAPGAATPRFLDTSVEQPAGTGR